jgi:hypothetical protein
MIFNPPGLCGEKPSPARVLPDLAIPLGLDAIAA